MTRRSRAELSQAIFTAGRALGNASAMLNHAVAERLGLLPTDWECLAAVGDEGPVAAGQLAKLTGLSTGTVTGVIDRLEAAGYVRRTRDPHDRRRVLVEPVPEARATMMPLFEPMLAEMAALHERYSDQQLAVIGESMAHAARILHEHALRIRSDAKG